MSKGRPVLDPTEDDVRKLLACKVHLGTKNIVQPMERYCFARRKDGIHVFDLHMTWQKLILAARVIVAIENPADVCAVSARPYGQRAILKFAQYPGAQYVPSRFTPGTFTNQIQDSFMQPRILLITDPRTDHQAITESSYVNIPVVAFCDTDSPVNYVDLAIPCNNRGQKAIGMMYWMLTREILRMRGTIVRSVPWEIKVDLFFYRDPEDVLKKEEEAAQQAFLPPAQDFAAYDKASFEKTIEAGAGGSWGDDTNTWDAVGTTQWGAE
uniref:Small ribosomal subunit protein uS2 n=1 Tax=Eutreptiella gymnastica TaxID=73025 RepID=A0A7S1J8A4_9EUGL|mmetsp:Transcript_74218/g.131054  ORF Transcript_74218/g.131054 Transcript_74218/m.131054 type:complete len:268 (+) Transcript_74218:50-853(+)